MIKAARGAGAQPGHRDREADPPDLQHPAKCIVGPFHVLQAFGSAYGGFASPPQVEEEEEDRADQRDRREIRPAPAFGTSCQ